MNEEEPKEEVKPEQTQTTEEAPTYVSPREATMDEKKDEEVIDPVADVDVVPQKDVFTPDEKKPKRKKLRIILILILLIGAGAAAWLFLIKDKADTNQTANQSSEQPVTEVNSGKTPNRVIYAYRESESVPMTLYYRPAAGGDRVEITKLDKDEFINHFDVQKNVAVYTTEKGIYVSTDSGGKFTKVYELKEPPAGELGEQITGLKISTEATEIVFGLSPNPSSSNSVNSIGLDGSNKNELFKSEKAGVFIDGYSEASNKIVYSEGCYNCGGNKLFPLIRNLGTNETKKLSEDIAPGSVQDIDVNNDLSEVVVSHGVVDNPSDGFEISLVAPYTVSKINTDSGVSTTAATVGQAGEKNPNGTLKTRTVLAGFLAQTNDVYYSDDNEIFIAKGTDSSAAFGAASNILYASFVSEDYVISGFGSGTDNYELSYYDVKNKKSTQILLGDNNTTILGVATK